jgi:hypothetical protein
VGGREERPVSPSHSLPHPPSRTVFAPSLLPFLLFIPNLQDLSLLGRDARYTIIVDNSPASYLFQPENALACNSFIDDLTDQELYVLMDFLDELRRAKDVRKVLRQWAVSEFRGVEDEDLHSDSEGEGGGAGAYHHHVYPRRDSGDESSSSEGDQGGTAQRLDYGQGQGPRGGAGAGAREHKAGDDEEDGGRRAGRDDHARPLLAGASDSGGRGGGARGGLVEDDDEYR